MKTVDTLTNNDRLSKILSVGEEITGLEDLTRLIDSGEKIIAYDGFEPSGQMHIAQGILRTINVNKMISAGVKFKILIADWHAWANNKMNGDLDAIQLVGKYFVEVWRATGMDLENVEFVWASDLVKDHEYWKLVLKISRENSIKRVVRCAQIMGRKESMQLSAAQILYPCMQAADIFILGAQITQLGMDQRKVNMLAREVGEKIGFWKPVVVSHHMLMGLQNPISSSKSPAEKSIERKMSKSKPNTAIFMTDSKEDVEKKILDAWCPAGVVEENPILDYCKHILFEKKSELIVKRKKEFGGTLKFSSFEDLQTSFGSSKLHPADLKVAVARELNELLEPVREHFRTDSHAKKLLKKVRELKISR
ncbi:MAG: tyrosine--tRNA ligase [Candidatus Pacebacteria bacterium CG10_big_fil_rev_8_21_14_0_10_44_11]|nr:MAG: tyrosine--tRNA ligase [Candidatus Pacebacteria bacterium CG10_big_fil_rev_8_21_14_0_10_44_11]